MIEFTTIGLPAPQGSKSKWGSEDNPRTKPWRLAVAADAAQAMGDTPLLDGAVTLDVIFWFPRPKNHFGTGKNAGTLKDSAATWKTGTPDLDKLVRAIGDSLKGVILRDDSQIARVDAVKMYGEPPRADIRVVPLDNTAPSGDNPHPDTER